jgi:hypothetical protein
MSVLGTSSDQGSVSMYAAMRDDGDLTIILINKAIQPLTCPLTVSSFVPQGPAEVYRYSGANLLQIVRESDLPIPVGQASIALPASSITLLVVPGTAVDCDGDGDIDVADFACFADCMSGPLQDPSPDCTRFDLATDGHVDLMDFAHFTRLGN